MRFLRESDRLDAPDARTVEIQPEDLAELQPVRRYPPTEHVSDQLAAGGTVEPAYTPDLWDWLSYAAPWFGVGSILGVVLLVVLEIIKPWEK